MAYAELIAPVVTQTSEGVGIIEGLVGRGEVALVTVAGGIDERYRIAERAGSIEGEDGDVDGAFGIVDGVGYGGRSVDVAVGEVSFLHTHIREGIVLVKHTIDDRDFLPLGVGREFHIAGRERQ